MPIDKSVLDKAEVAFIGARINLMSSKPFWAHLVMKMRLEWMEDVPGGVSCTDGERVIINPVPFLAMDREERATVLVHEAWHCAAGHLWRRGPRDPLLWNLAGDICIANSQEADDFKLLDLQEKFFATQGIDRLRYKNMSAEEVYEELPKQMKCSGGGKGKGKGGDGQCSHWQEGGCFQEPNSGQSGQNEQKWRQAVIEAGQLAGNAPGAWQELVKAAMPKPPFQLKLLEYLARGLGGDTSWDALDRRFIWQGGYFPSSTKQVMGDVALMVDVSGSMDGEAHLKPALGYCRGFREQHPHRAYFIQCDHDCVDAAQFQVYEEHEPLPEVFKIFGRGGTSFDPPFKLLREKRVEPKVAVYFTDSYGSVEESSRPNYPVLWVVVGGAKEFNPPFGEVIFAPSK